MLVRGTIAAAAAGIVDIALEEYDKRQKRGVPFKRVTEYGRIGMLMGGLVTSLLFKAKAGDIGNAIFFSMVPLIEKSIKDGIVATVTPKLAPAPVAPAAMPMKVELVPLTTSTPTPQTTAPSPAVTLVSL